MRILAAWIGATDLRASRGELPDGPGPIRAVVEARQYDRIVLLSNYRSDESRSFVSWLKGVSRTPIDLELRKLSSPTDFSEIHEAVVSALTPRVREAGPAVRLTFHLSPGTPAMAAVWIILAKTRFPAELVESSREAGVKTVSVPFDISAEYLPDLLRRPDEELSRLTQGLPPEAPGFEEIIHRSREMKEAVAWARQLALRNVSVLIEGESGTGKELFARAIHRSSPRATGPFIAVNCGAIPDALVESELFGHQKGAFTGAVAARAGHFEQASGGTIFLDEIGELPLAAQVKMLRVLETRQVVRVGESTPRAVDIRVIGATNRDLLAGIETGKFREDLYHRIAVGIIRLPAIRVRRGDMDPLIDHLLDRINDDAAMLGIEAKAITPAARNLLKRQEWRGNVRELGNVLLRASLAAGPTIGPAELRAALPPHSRGEPPVLGRPLGGDFRLEDLLSGVARHYLTRAMEETGGNKTKAAELVGFASYQTLTNWLKRHGLDT